MTAYVGEVIVRHADGEWQMKASRTGAGPTLVFPVRVDDGPEHVHYKAIDIHNHVLTTFLEGESLVKWYEEEVING